jgi:hypothetical protein
MRDSFPPVVLRPLRVWSGRACFGLPRWASDGPPSWWSQISCGNHNPQGVIDPFFFFPSLLVVPPLVLPTADGEGRHPTPGIEKSSFFIFLFRFAFFHFFSVLFFFFLIFFFHRCCLRPPYCCGLTASRGRFAGGKRRRTSAAGMQPDQTATRWESKGILPGCCR